MHNNEQHNMLFNIMVYLMDIKDANKYIFNNLYRIIKIIKK